MDSLSPAVAAVVVDLKRRITERFGVRLLEYVLFGSHARGEVNADSDVDVFVVVKDMASREKREIYEMAAEIWADTGVDVSPLARSDREAAELRRLERRLIRDIDAEGAPL